MPPNCERLLGPAGNVKTDPHRGSLPKWLRTCGIGPRAVADSWAGQRVLHHRLAAAYLRHNRVHLLAIIRHSAVGNVIPKPAFRRIQGIELRKIDRRNTSGHPIYKQPLTSFPLPPGTALFPGQTVLMRKARRTTNKRSVTSCGEPRTYSFTRPSTISACTFNTGGLLALVPANLGTKVHLPKLMTCGFAAAATSLARKAMAKITIPPREFLSRLIPGYATCPHGTQQASNRQGWCSQLTHLPSRTGKRQPCEKNIGCAGNWNARPSHELHDSL